MAKKTNKLRAQNHLSSVFAKVFGILLALRQELSWWHLWRDSCLFRNAPYLNFVLFLSRFSLLNGGKGGRGRHVRHSLCFRKSDTQPLKTLQSAEIRNLGALSEMSRFNLKG